MARKKSSRRKKQAPTAPSPVSRRDFMTRIIYGGIGGFALLGGGMVVANSYKKFTTEHDLSAVGRGKPTVVQIHDPQCQLCRQLQSQTRKALKRLDQDSVLYRIADIRTDAGAAFQNQQALPHVTLVILDGDGKRLGTVQGVTPADQIETTLRATLGL